MSARVMFKWATSAGHPLAMAVTMLAMLVFVHAEIAQRPSNHVLILGMKDLSDGVAAMPATPTGFKQAKSGDTTTPANAA